MLGQCRTPFECLVGVMMRNKEDQKLKKFPDEELINNFAQNQDELRNEAKLRIQKFQEENKMTFKS